MARLVHAVFQRQNGKNSMRFNDGMPNSRPGSGAPFDYMYRTSTNQYGRARYNACI
jgi:hypothetical protein